MESIKLKRVRQKKVNNNFYGCKKEPRIREKNRRDEINNGIELLRKNLNDQESNKYLTKIDIINGCIKMMEELEKHIAFLQLEREILEFTKTQIYYQKLEKSSGFF